MRERDAAYMVDGSEVSRLRKIALRPPVYLLAVGGQDVRLNIEQLLSWARFEKAVIEQTDQPPLIFAPDPRAMNRAWRDILNPLFDAIEVIEAPDDASPEGILVEAVRKWLANLPCEEERSGILTGATWRHPDGRLFFRSEFLYVFLESQPVLKSLTVGKVWEVLREEGFAPEQTRYGKANSENARAWTAPAGFVSVEPEPPVTNGIAHAPPVRA